MHVAVSGILATEGVHAFGLHFESVGAPELGDVTDANKVDFIKRKIHMDLIECRKSIYQLLKMALSRH